MWYTFSYILTLYLVLHNNYSRVFGADNRKFPPNFQLGVATAAYQVEGGWDADGKGENIWDHYTHTRPDVVVDLSNADVACDAYHKIDQDIELLKNLGVDFYRFSIAWSRILPTGYVADGVNQAGVDYYNNLLDGLQEAGIDAMVTLYHWDLPQKLEDDFEGWTREDIVDVFADYANLAFELFGDRVKYWVTFNEPNLVCGAGYEGGSMAPGVVSPGVLLYYCGHYLLKAHAKAYHIYDQQYRRNDTKISIVLNTDWFEPSSESALDLEATERQRQFYFGWFAHPIFHGNYPQVMIDRIAERSAQEAFIQSRLPVFTEEEIEYIKGTHDYIGLNHYTTNYVLWTEDAAIGEPGYSKDISVSMYKNDSWEGSASSWLKVVPWGMRKIVTWIKDTYNDTEIIVTENGISDRGDLQDDRRINYFREYLSSIIEAIYDDNTKVIGYTGWSFMDNFEWNQGYTEKFGLYNVDFEDPEKPRTPKASVEYFKQIKATRCLVDVCEQNTYKNFKPMKRLL